MFSLKRFLVLYLNCMFLGGKNLIRRHQTGSNLVHPATHFILSLAVDENNRPLCSYSLSQVPRHTLQ